MESRLRKLLSLKKSRGQPLVANSELDLHSVPYTTVQPQGRFPVLLSHALGRPATAKRKDDKSNGIHSFSYNATVPGTPPELGDRPQRGNGPVKLQTSRRLSSGELLVTQQDYDRTLEDIRHGEYIVGENRGALLAPSSRRCRQTSAAHVHFYCSKLARRTVHLFKFRMVPCQ